MILVTGGGGFIGSNLVASLIEAGHSAITVCDLFGEDDKWHNLRKHPVHQIITPELLEAYLDAHSTEITCIFHMGAISSTTERDVDKILHANTLLSITLWEWCAKHNVAFIYASSAATYGDGSHEFEDSEDLDYLEKLQPLNPYAWSKHLFDLYAVRAAQQKKPTPPQWAGLKFFNVYGPNEEHKAGQKSVINQLFHQAEQNETIKLFSSYHPDYKDGEQLRDFVYVDDCCNVMLWLMNHPDVSGLFNVGSGTARSFNDVAHNLIENISDTTTSIEYIDMPEILRNTYQYHTKADLSKLREAGYDVQMTGLEEGIARYITKYLTQPDPYR